MQIQGEYGKADVHYIPLVTAGSEDLKANPTIVAGDVKISIDGGAFVNLATLPTVTPAGGVSVKMPLSSAEMQGRKIFVQFIDQTATKEWADQTILITTDVDSRRQRLFDHISYLTGHHTPTGNVFYWDPENGDDGNDGLTHATARLTFAGVYALVTAHNHDLIFGLPGTSGAQTVVTEAGIDMNKAYSFLEIVGRDWLFQPITATAPTIKLSAEGCKASGFIAKTHTSGSQDAIHITGDFCYLHDFYVEYSRGHGVNMEGTSHSKLSRFRVQDSAQGGSGHGVFVDGTGTTTEWNVIEAAQLFENAGDGIQMKGANAKHTFIVTDGATIIHGNTGYGIRELSGADENIIIGAAMHVGHNTAGEISLIGANSSQDPDLKLLEKHILNKLVVGDSSIILYDDDGVTPLKTWAYDPVTATRSAAT